MKHPFDRLIKAAGGGPRRAACRPGPSPPPLPSGEQEGAFDRLARSLAEEVPRREALRRLGGGLAAALLASLGLRAGWSQGTGAGSGCGNVCNAAFSPDKPATRAKNAKCKASCEACDASGGVRCGIGADGRMGCCSGGSSSTCCGAACVDTQTSASHCGSCGNTCPEGKECVGGVCQCPLTQAECGGACVDTATDVNNCGSCGNVCPSEKRECVGPDGTGQGNFAFTHYGPYCAQGTCRLAAASFIPCGTQTCVNGVCV
jgi:hypothetical protein